MFCCRVGNVLCFSKVYNCNDASTSVARVLVAVLLATSKLTSYPTHDGVSFGQPKSVPLSNGLFELFLDRQEMEVQQVWKFLFLFIDVSPFFIMQMAPTVDHVIISSTTIDPSSTPGKLLDI